VFPDEVGDSKTFFQLGSARWMVSPSRVDTLFHDLSRGLFLGHRLAPMVDDGFGLRGCGFGLDWICSAAVVGDAGVGAVLACGTHCCGEVVVGG
jgi:hypothetical protein